MAESLRIRDKRIAIERKALQSRGITYTETQRGDSLCFQLQGISVTLPSGFPFENPAVSLKVPPESFHRLELEEADAALLLPGYRVNMKLYELADAVSTLPFTPLGDLPPCLLYKVLQSGVSVALLGSLLLRALVGLGGYSGRADSPLYGDYEAQRNWMELTINREVAYWYQQGSSPWWRLDYPPLSGYHAWLFGQLARVFVPEAVALGARGFQSQAHKFFMRTAVVVSEAVLFAGGLLLFKGEGLNRTCQLALLVVALNSPLLLLIDHGHFQFNCVLGGLLWLSVWLILQKRMVPAAVVFSLALNFKQTTLFYSLPVFAYYLGHILRRTGLLVPGRGLSVTGPRLFGLGCHVLLYAGVVLTTLLVPWLPWLLHDGAKSLLSAIFPVHRGLYQLKVANFWCSTDPLVKWQNHLSDTVLLTLGASATVLLSAPSITALLKFPQRKFLLLGLFLSSTAAFFFGFHMHEKTVLVPLFAALLCLRHLGRKVVHFGVWAAFANYHLMKEDELALQYFVLLSATSLLSTQTLVFLQQAGVVQPETGWWERPYQLFNKAGLSLLVLLHGLDRWVEPPARLPFLFNYLFATLSFLGLLAVWACAGLRLRADLGQKEASARQQQRSKGHE